MHTHTYAHEHTCACITQSTDWTTDTETHNLYTNMQTQTHTHEYKRIHIHTHTHTHIYIYIYIYTCLHTYTHTHVYTHAYKMYMWTHANHVWNDGVVATAREAQLDTKKICPSLCPLQSRGGYPSWPAAQLPVHEGPQISAEQPQPTAAHHTITTGRHPDHIRLSALVRSQSTQFTAHPSCQFGCGPPKRGHFSANLVGVF